MAELQNLSIDIPPQMPRPESGTSTYRITLLVRDATGALVDPDGSACSVIAVNAALSTLGSVTMVRESQGQYSGLYSVTSAHADGQVRFSGFCNISAVTKFVIASNNVVPPINSVALNAVMLGVSRPHVVQVATLTGVPTGGTFVLAYKGQATSGLAYNAAAATVQTALLALSTIGTGNVTVSGSAGGPYTITFGGTLDLDNLRALSSSHSLTGGTAPNVSMETTVRFYRSDGTTLAVTITYKNNDGMRSASVTV